MSYALRVRETLAALPRPDRLALVPRLWGDALAGRLSDEEAEALVELAQGGAHEGPAPAHRRPLMRVPKRPTPRSTDREKSIQRRRRVAASGAMPPALAAHFTQGQVATLAVVAGEVRKSGSCLLAVDAIAARAGVSRRTAQVALRTAERLGLLAITERRLSAYRCQTNRVTVISREWLAWLRIGPPQGCKNPQGTDRIKYSPSGSPDGNRQKMPAKPAEGHRNWRSGKGGGSPPLASR